MDLSALLLSLIPSWTSVAMILLFFTYLAIPGSLFPGKVIPGAALSDGTRLHYRCNGLLSLILLITMLHPGRFLFLFRAIARHDNYLGDLLVALSFSLPCVISSPVPYFYPTYLFVLLIWRERRDEARCAQKHKEVWAEYRNLVPWRILPYVY